MEKDARLLAGALERAGEGLILVVTGAGVSAASGLPTFRGTDPEAIWNRDVTEIGTRRFFERDPVAWWTWFLDAFAGLDEARPNPAHNVLAALERWQLGRGGDFLLVTQNIDTLHERAGSRRLVKVHGTADRLRCSRDGCALGAPAGSLPRTEVDLAAFRRDPGRHTLPRCPACGALLRAHALLFDELYDEHVDYGFERVRGALERMGVVLFAGTSFSVGVTALVLREALGWRVPVLSIDPAAAPPLPGITGLRVPAEGVLPAACRELGIAAGS
ncbi:MAG TPA: Sir2 family NAD-dependent protein deacetylase [Thermoanaerobaculia bacterium]|jgi:NAD-dependent deacetylase|nr:Sir2 family NAD-dependent protein deacetylase [Thermoanaerobaculia bacterium]